MADGTGPGTYPGPAVVSTIGRRLIWVGLVGALLALGSVLVSLSLLAFGCSLPPALDLRVLVPLTGIFFAIFALAFNAEERLIQSRKQHTIKILFDTRLSAEFRQHLEWRKQCFPETKIVDHETYFAHLQAQRSVETSDETALERRKSAEAVRSLLNYYEFIALGIASGDLDADMMYQSVRGIMCNLVADMHLVVAEYRRRNARTYRHLAALYRDWKDPDQPDIA